MKVGIKTALAAMSILAMSAGCNNLPQTSANKLCTTTETFDMHTPMERVDFSGNSYATFSDVTITSSPEEMNTVAALLAVVGAVTIPAAIIIGCKLKNDGLI